MDYSTIKGFNYQPSYGSTSLEIWQGFDENIIRTELNRGKKYFPKMNAIRLWLSWDSFVRNPDKFLKNFNTVLNITEENNIIVMPVLFNRWHNDFLDCGGIYIDHFLPKASLCQETENLFEPYIEKLIGSHYNDKRIFAWDLCNEPFSYHPHLDINKISEIVKSEYNWLKRIYNYCKKYNAKAPLTIGINNYHGLDDITRIEPISDVLSIHPYWCCNSPPHEKEEFERQLNDFQEFAYKAGKPLIATETCWGSQDDEEHVKIIKYTLGELKKRKIGWLVHLLNHSLVADAHREEYGPVSYPGNLSFIEADGSLRKGHEIFNEF